MVPEERDSRGADFAKGSEGEAGADTGRRAWESREDPQLNAFLQVAAKTFACRIAKERGQARPATDNNKVTGRTSWPRAGCTAPASVSTSSAVRLSSQPRQLFVAFVKVAFCPSFGAAAPVPEGASADWASCLKAPISWQRSSPALWCTPKLQSPTLVCQCAEALQ